MDEAKVGLLTAVEESNIASSKVQDYRSWHATPEYQFDFCKYFGDVTRNFRYIQNHVWSYKTCLKTPK